MAKSKTKDKFEGYRNTLLEKQREVIDTFDRDRAAGSAQPDDGIQDLADKAFLTYSKELNFSLSDVERLILLQIEEALVRTRDGSFGVCTNCGVTIGEKRLIAIPWTPFCIDCQELHEQGGL
jgi:DnaK suppressor protein